MLRFVSSSYNVRAIQDDDILKYIHFDTELYCPHLKDIVKYSIITTTLVNAGRYIEQCF